jgi:hypothetical protein
MGALRGSSGSHGSYVDLSKFDVKEKHVLENLTDANLQQLAADAPANHKFKTRIICTLGPVSREVSVLEEMLKKGMNIARFNFSHGDHAYHKGTLDNLRIASKNLGIRCGVLLDTKGPEIRTGMLDHGEPVFLEKDSEITLTTDYDIKGNKNLIAGVLLVPRQGCRARLADPLRRRLHHLHRALLRRGRGDRPGAMREQRQARRAQEHEPPRRQRRPSHHHGEGPRRHPQLGRQEQG